MRTVAVAGASLAGLRSVQELRDQGFTGRVVVIGEEPHAPYDRPPLSKAFLAGALPADDLALGDLDELDAEWRLGVRAERVDAQAGEIHLLLHEHATGPFADTGAKIKNVYVVRRT